MPKGLVAAEEDQPPVSTANTVGSLNKKKKKM